MGESFNPFFKDFFFSDKIVPYIAVRLLCSWKWVNSGSFTYRLKYNLSIFKCGHMLYVIKRMEGKSNNREILFFLLSLLLGDRFITLPNSILVTIRILFLYSFLLICIISYVLIPLFTKSRQWVLPGGRLCIAPGVGNKGLHFL